MELDKRIKEGKRPLTCFDLKEAEQFIGKKGYFSHYILYASCETPETWDHDYRIGIKAAVSYFLNKEELFNTK